VVSILAAGRGWAVPIVAVLLAAVTCAAAALVASRLVTWYRRAMAASRILTLFVAFLVPALLVYPSVSFFGERSIRRLVERTLALRPVTDVKQFDDFYSSEDAATLRALPEATRTSRGDAGQLGLPLVSDDFLGDAASYSVNPPSTVGPDARDASVVLQSISCVVTANVHSRGAQQPAFRVARLTTPVLCALLVSRIALVAKGLPATSAN